MGLRVPPHDVDAERSLLGAMLLSRDAVVDACEHVSVDSFYVPAHAKIFDAIRCLSDRSIPVDAVTVADELRKRDALDSVGGAGVLLSLMTVTPSTTAASRYAQIVQRAFMLRSLIGVSAEISEMAYASPDNAADVLDRAETMVYDVSRARVFDTDFSMASALSDVVDDLEKNETRGGVPSGTPTGFIDLDGMLGGLQCGTLNILGARPAMGKSALALSIAHHASVESGFPALFFSLEMPTRELMQRLVSMDARVDSSKMRFGKMDADDWDRVTGSVGVMRDAPLIIEDDANVSIGEIRGKARRVAQRFGTLGLVVVDYVQLMNVRGAENRQLEIAEISRGLKLLAKELDCPVLALAQLNRGLEQRADKRPMLSDLRESGALEQDADTVMFIYRDEVYNPDSADRGMAEVLVAKHRAGPTGVVQLAFLSRFTRFADMYRG